MKKIKAFGIDWKVTPSVMPNHIKLHPTEEVGLETPIHVGDSFISEEVEYRVDAICVGRVLVARPMDNPSQTK